MGIDAVSATGGFMGMASTPCTACLTETREKQPELAGPARASYQLDPPPSVDMRAIPDAMTAVKIDASGLSKEEQSVVDQLRVRDREVRNHEQAHARVGGPYAGEPSYTYQTGPDGNRYAVGGEVAIDIAPIKDDPEATIEKMEVVKAAALATAEPSAQDRKVAALADVQRAQALADLAALRNAVNGREEVGLKADLRL